MTPITSLAAVQSAYERAIRLGDGVGRVEQAAASVFDRAAEAAMAGEPRPTEPPLAVQGWDRGNATRRIRAGEAIGMVCLGTKCDACGEQNWGWRLGCRCNTALDFQTVRHGLLVDDGLPEGACAKFMTTDEVRAVGKPLIDIVTGATVPLPA